MTAFSATTTFAQIWEQVRSWPPAERKRLVAQLIESLPPDFGPPDAAPAKPTTSAAELIGLWADIEPKPTDEDLQRILEDSIVEKHWS